jgi:hypothetical protein
MEAAWCEIPESPERLPGLPVITGHEVRCDFSHFVFGDSVLLPRLENIFQRAPIRGRTTIPESSTANAGVASMTKAAKIDRRTA